MDCVKCACVWIGEGWELMGVRGLDFALPIQWEQGECGTSVCVASVWVVSNGTESGAWASVLLLCLCVCC